MSTEITKDTVKTIRAIIPPTTLQVAGVIPESIVDGPGIRYVVFAQGCRHRCPGCHNPQTQSFEGGSGLKIGSVLRDMGKNPLLDGITFSGGEPFLQAAAFSELARQVKKQNKDWNVLVYSGYTYEELLRRAAVHTDWSSLLNAVDILVDGPFVQEKKSYELLFRGSSNQRVIDMEQTRRAGRVVLSVLSDEG